MFAHLCEKLPIFWNYVHDFNRTKASECKVAFDTASFAKFANERAHGLSFTVIRIFTSCMIKAGKELKEGNAGRRIVDSGKSI